MRGKKTFHFYDLHFFHAKAKKNVLYSASGKCARRSENIRTRTHTSISSCENLIKTSAHTQSQTKGMQPTSRGKTTIAWEKRQKKRNVPQRNAKDTQRTVEENRENQHVFTRWQRKHFPSDNGTAVWNAIAERENSSENSCVKKDEPQMELTFRNALTFWNFKFSKKILEPVRTSGMFFFQPTLGNDHPSSVAHPTCILFEIYVPTEVTKLKH